MPEKEPKPAAAKSIMDVTRPGKSAPSPNSKSVIVGNRPMLKDPMVVDETDNSLAKVSSKAKERLLTAPLLETEEPDMAAAGETGVTKKPAAAKPKHKRVEQPAKTPETVSHAKSAKVIAPSIDNKPAEPPKLIGALSVDELPPKAEPSEAPEKPVPAKPVPPTEPSSKPAKTEDKPEAQPEAEPEAKPAPQPATKPTEEEAKAGAITTAGSPEAVQTEDDKQAQHQAAVEKLADSKKYYLPINMVEKRRSKHFAVAGIILSLLLIVAWADIALDAGLIKVAGIKPLTHFFSN